MLGSKRFWTLDFFDTKVLVKLSYQVDYLNVKYFESNWNLENLELDCGPAQPNLFNNNDKQNNKDKEASSKE